MTKENIIHMLQGVCIGDAFGVGLEFSNRAKIKEHVTYDQFHNWRTGVYAENLQPGFYSDDTEHTFAVCEALLSTNYSAKHIAFLCAAEYARDTHAKGFGRLGHGSIIDYYNGDNTIAEVRAAQRQRVDPGNAPVMRCLPLVCVPEDLQYQYAVINALATHENIRGIEASVMVVAAANYLLRKGGTRDGLIPYLKTYATWIDPQRLEVVDALPHPSKLQEENYVALFGLQSIPMCIGLPCEAMTTATTVVYILKHATSAFEALRYSIEMGGDIDSLAAVTVGVTSALYGIDSLPLFLRNETEGLQRAEFLAGKLHERFFSKQFFQ